MRVRVVCGTIPGVLIHQPLMGGSEVLIQQAVGITRDDRMNDYTR